MLTVSDDWASCIGVERDQVYMSFGGGVVGVYDISGTPGLDTWTQVMGYPQRIRFGATSAYMPLGNSGMEQMDY